MVKHHKLLSVANLGIIKHITTIYYLFNGSYSKGYFIFNFEKD